MNTKKKFSLLLLALFSSSLSMQLVTTDQRHIDSCSEKKELKLLATRTSPLIDSPINLSMPTGHVRNGHVRGWVYTDELFLAETTCSASQLVRLSGCTELKD